METTQLSVARVGMRSCGMAEKGLELCEILPTALHRSDLHFALAITEILANGCVCVSDTSRATSVLLVRYSQGTAISAVFI